MLYTTFFSSGGFGFVFSGRVFLVEVWVGRLLQHRKGKKVQTTRQKESMCHCQDRQGESDI